MIEASTAGSAVGRVSVLELFTRRRSVRAFSERGVEPEKLDSVLEAARWAPSCYNEQPWRFVVATKEDPDGDHDRLLGCLSEGNRRWAREAPVLMFSAAKLFFDRNGEPNRHALHDVGLAVGNLVAQATSLGLSVHQMAGFDREKVRSACGIPEGYEPVACIALGYAGDPRTLPEDLRERELAPRIRKPLCELVFRGRFHGSYAAGARPGRETENGPKDGKGGPS